MRMMRTALWMGASGLRKLMRQHRQKLILEPIGFLQLLLGAGALENLAVQRAIGCFEAGNGLTQRGVQGLELAGLFRLQVQVGG